MPKHIRTWYRKERRRWYGEYWLNGKRHAKSFANKLDALRWQSYMSHKLNYEEWQGIVGVEWNSLVKIYLEHKDSQDIAPKTRVEIVNSLRQFGHLIEQIHSNLITQQHIEKFIRKRKKHVANRTVNKDLESLRAFYLWMVKCHYAHAGIEFHMLKTMRREYRPPTSEQLSDLLRLAQEYPPLYVRIVLAIVTGLRRSAIERLTLNNTQEAYIDIEQSLLVTIESKGRQQIVKQLGPNTLQIVVNYIDTLPAGSQKLFTSPWDGKVRFTWQRIRREAGLPRMTFHNLRNLSLSILADKGESGAVLQKHAAHKSYTTTSRYIGISHETQSRVTMKLDGLFGE